MTCAGQGDSRAKGQPSVAMDERQRAIDGISRRNVLRGGLVGGVGLATVGAVSGVLTGTAKASTPNPQGDWGWCQYCATMWYTPNRSSSFCMGPEAPLSHHAVGSGSYNYYQVNNQSTDTPTGNPQSDWNWCGYCQGLFWGGATGNQGVCGGNNLSFHVSGGTNYDLWHGKNPTTGEQAYWRWCGNCYLLYYQGPSGTTAGSCPALDVGGPVHHVAGSGTVYDIGWSGTY
jgi:hypothetical protein